jgi:prepilin-type N-terminal cleavage/methylation domain-containing protein
MRFWYTWCYPVSVIFHKNQTKRHGPHGPGGFTLVEAVVALSVLGIGVASTIGALTKFNAFAGTSRNATGAYTVVMNHVDLFQSMSPFNPQKTNDDGTAQIPKFIEASNNPQSLASYDMTIGTHTIGYKDPTTGVVSNKWPVYQYKDPNTGTVVVVNGTLTITVSAVASLSNTYLGVISLTYTYLNRNYTYSLSSIRTSDI